MGAAPQPSLQACLTEPGIRMIVWLPAHPGRIHAVDRDLVSKEVWVQTVLLSLCSLGELTWCMVDFFPPFSLCCPKCSQLWSRHRVSTSGPPCTLLGSWHHSLQTIFRNMLSSAHSYAKTTLVLGTRHSSQPSRLQHFVDPPSFDKKRRLSNYTQFSTNIECTRMLMPPSGTISLRNWLNSQSNCSNLVQLAIFLS